MASLYNIRSVVICLLAFAAFLRIDELAKLVRFDVKIENDMLKLFIQSSKTDQYRDGVWIVVASSRKATCPVAMMNRYLDRAGLSCDSPLFCQLSKTKCGFKPRSKGLSYSRLRELEAFKDIVPDISAIGTHSPRLLQMLAYQIDFLSVMAVGLVNRLRTDMCKILYLLVCRFLRL